MENSPYRSAYRIPFGKDYTLCFRCLAICLAFLSLRCVGDSEIVRVYQAVPNATYYGMNATLHCLSDSEESRQWGVAWELVRNDSYLPTIICPGIHAPPLQWHGKYECRSDGNRHSLFIQNVSFNDSGNYVCIEDGGRGPDRDSFELLILRKYSPGARFTKYLTIYYKIIIRLL